MTNPTDELFADDPNYMSNAKMAKRLDRPEADMKQLELVFSADAGTPEWWKRVSPTLWTRLDADEIPSDVTLS